MPLRNHEYLMRYEGNFNLNIRHHYVQIKHFIAPNKIYFVSFGEQWHFPFNFWMDGCNVTERKFDSDRKISVILDRTLAVVAATAVQNLRITGYFLIRSNGICRINGTFLIGSNVMLAPWDQVDLLEHWTIFKNSFSSNIRWSIFCYIVFCSIFLILCR